VANISSSIVAVTSIGESGILECDMDN
jgi:hypothetical protein